MREWVPQPLHFKRRDDLALRSPLEAQGRHKSAPTGDHFGAWIVQPHGVHPSADSETRPEAGHPDRARNSRSGHHLIRVDTSFLGIVVEVFSSVQCPSDVRFMANAPALFSRFDRSHTLVEDLRQERERIEQLEQECSQQADWLGFYQAELARMRALSTLAEPPADAEAPAVVDAVPAVADAPADVPAPRPWSRFWRNSRLRVSP